ncbi:Hypothetical Protein FCC1311_111732 [Hondaea fermentalgiana]|uniref:Uncharacterized protein n=1 Tax=Hondaea fermentalgiana TaxID=2315210 RepID=A0A2R5GVT2_9STRA|nr:Hypothetical Protein FCC1311_111732 [Hondaea fermentalgiana]|eukprot:GBG34950.1 Hypothetical Protein FCC1311_111732 [Hondaea fermentalgiana]
MGSNSPETWSFLEKQPLVLVSPDEALEICDLNGAAQRHLDKVMSKLDAIPALQRRLGVDKTAEADAYLAFLGSSALRILMSAMKESMDKSNRSHLITDWELHAFLGQALYIAGCTRYPKEAAPQAMRAEMANTQIFPTDAILDPARFDELRDHLSSSTSAHASSDPEFDEDHQVEGLDSLEIAALDQTMSLVVDNHLRIGFEDRHVSTCPFHNAPTQNGADATKCMTSVDALLGLKLASGLSTQDQQGDSDGLMHVLERAKNVAGGDLAGAELYLDHEPLYASFFSECARLGLPLVVSQKTDATSGSCPFSLVERAEGDARDGANSAFVVANSSFLGSQIFSAKTLVQVEDVADPQVMHAFAVRQPTSHSRARLSRFLTLNDADAWKRFRNTFVLEPLRRAPDALTENWLFYPEQSELQDLDHDISLLLNAKETAKNGGAARQDSLGDENDDDDHEDIDKSASESFASSELEVENSLREDTDRADVLPMHRIRDVDIPSKNDIERALADMGVFPLSAGKYSADWHVFNMLLINDRAAVAIAKRSAECRRLVFRNPSKVAEQAKDALESQLCRIWFESNGASYQASPTSLAPSTLEQLRGQDWVAAVFAVGLVRIEDRPFIGTSADGVVVVQVPGNAAQEMRVLAPLRIGPRVTHDKSTFVAEKYGTYFSCVAGSTTWFEVVPLRHRSELLHQAIVYGTTHGVFYAQSARGTCAYMVLVLFPQKVRDTWNSAVEDIGRSLVDWAYAQDPGAADPASIPSAFGSASQEMIASNLPLWNAFHKQRATNGVAMPVRRASALVQFKFAASSRGAHVYADYADRLDLRQLKLGERQASVLGIFSDVVINAFLAWRMRKFIRKRGAGETWLDVQRVLAPEQGAEDFSLFIRAVSFGLMTHASRLRDPVPQLPDLQGPAFESAMPDGTEGSLLSAEEHQILRIPTGKRGVFKLANTIECRRLRLSSVQQEDTCWAQWHTNRTLSREPPPWGKNGVQSHEQPSVDNAFAAPSLAFAEGGDDVAQGPNWLSAEEHEALRLPTGKRNVIKIANTHECKRLRLSSNAHRQHTLKDTRFCVVCGTNARIACKFCNVVLHVQRRSSVNQVDTCWSQWHNDAIVKRRELARKSRPAPSDAAAETPKN